MTSSVTSRGDLKVVYIFHFKQKITFFVITEERTKIWSSNLVYMCNMEFWIRLYKLSRIAKLMTSSGLKISQNFELQ